MISKITRNTRINFYQRARYSYAIVEQKDFKEATKEFFFFDRAKLNAKWFKKIFSPHFSIRYWSQGNYFLISDMKKNRHIELKVYLYNHKYEAVEKLNGIIAIDRLDQSIQALNDWTNEELNFDCKLREKVKALLDTLENYKHDYYLIEGINNGKR